MLRLDQPSACSVAIGPHFSPGVVPAVSKNSNHRVHRTPNVDLQSEIGSWQNSNRLSLSNLRCNRIFGPYGVGINAELDRFTGFGRIGFWFGIHCLSGWRVSHPPDNPMPSSSFIVRRNSALHRPWLCFGWGGRPSLRDLLRLKILASAHSSMRTSAAMLAGR